MHGLRLRPLLLAVPFFLGVAAPAEAGHTAHGGKSPYVYYTFKTKGSPKSGGVAAAHLDPGSGRIISQSVVGQDRLFMRPHKIEVSPSGRYLLATSQHAGMKNILLADLAAGTHQLLSVDRVPDHVGVWGEKFVVGAEDRMCYIIDAPSGTVEHRWFGRHELRPDGRRIEYVTTTPDGTAWTSWQKDSGSGNSKGSRMVTIDILSGKTIADLQLPRSMPQLHLADRKERGPNPEIIIPSTRSNTLLLSMDLYGGIALADLDAAREGRWENLTYQSVATDESWGTAFPDRATLFTSGGRDYVLVANAGKEGGVSLVDLAGREVVQRIETPPGLSAPVALSGGTLLAAPVPGKWKARSFGRLVEKREPLESLYLFRVSGGRLSVSSVSLPVACDLIAPVGSSDLVLLTSGSEILTVRASSGQVVDRRDAVGKIERIAFR